MLSTHIFLTLSQRLYIQYRCLVNCLLIKSVTARQMQICFPSKRLWELGSKLFKSCERNWWCNLNCELLVFKSCERNWWSNLNWELLVTNVTNSLLQIFLQYPIQNYFPCNVACLGSLEVHYWQQYIISKSVFFLPDCAGSWRIANTESGKA